MTERVAPSTLAPRSDAGPRSAASLVLDRQPRPPPVPRRTGPRAELGSLRARAALHGERSDIEGERAALLELCRALAARGSELEAAIKYARRALTLGDDTNLREELSGWFAGIGEPLLAARTLRALAGETSGRSAAQIWTRVAVLSARAGDAATAVDALSEASQQSPEDAVPWELLGATFAWAPEVVSAERAASAYLEAASRREARGERAVAFEHLLRAFEIAPACAPAAERLFAALSARGRQATADEVARWHAGFAGDRAAVLHAQRAERALREGDLARALGAALDARWEAALDGPAAVSCDEILERAGLYELLAARLELACDAATAALVAGLRLKLGRLYAGPLASPERAAEAWIAAVLADPACEEAKVSLREHAASTRDPLPLVEALIRVGLAEEAVLKGRVACLRELSVLAEQRLSDPGLALWALRTLLRLSAEDEESQQALRRLVPRARLQDEALSEARATLESAEVPLRVECLRKIAAILQGRPDRVDEQVNVLQMLVELVPDERIWTSTLERVLSRHARYAELAAAFGSLAARLPEGAERERHALLAATATRRAGDERSALHALRPFVQGARAQSAASHLALVLATRLGDEQTRAEALVRLAAPLAPALRAALLSVAAELWLAFGDVVRARDAADQACAADPSAARPVAARAEIALRDAPAASAQALERATAVLIPRGSLCEALCEAYVALENPGLALAFGQRELALCPASEGRLKRFLARVMHMGDAAKLADALVWLMSQAQPFKPFAAEIVRALRLLATRDRTRALAVARRVLDVLGPGVAEVRQALLDVAGTLAEPALGLAVLERWLATGAAGAVRADVLLALFERRVGFDDADAALRTLRRALADGAAPDTVLTLLARAPVAQSSDGELSALEARAEALSLRSDADATQGAHALRELGAARWDLCGDSDGAVKIWERAAELAPGQGDLEFAADLLAFAGPVEAAARLSSWALRVREPARASLAFALAAGIALEAGHASRALELAERALDLDPRRADALAVAERAATAADTEQLARIYERLGAASLGCYGERALNYRAARQLEKRGDAERALQRAIRAFEAVPSEGAAYVLMARLSERTPRSSEVVASLERVAAQCSGVEARAAWLRRAALFADASEEGRRQRVEVLLRALSTRADVATLRSLGEAFGALLELVPEDKDILELRFERALSSVLPGADGPEGARMAVEAARVALVVFDSAELAVRALTQATKADGSIDEFGSLQPFVARLANAPEAAHAYVTETVKSAGNRFSNLGRACLEFVASVASEFDDAAARAHLLVHAARRDPDDRALVRRAERAVQSAREPELEALLLEAVPLADRVLRLLERARAPEEPEERATACATLEQALAGSELAGELRARVFRELCELYGQTGRRDDLERLLTHEAERPGLESAARLLALRDLAALVAARGEPERALSLLLAVTSEPIDDESMLADIATLAGQTGAKRAQADALARLVDLTPEPAPKASALRELAAVLEALGESLAAATRWSELARLDPGDLTALMALERDAEARGDYAELSRVLGLRAVQATDPDDVRRIRLRRAVMLEQRLGRADEAREELEALLVATGDALSVLRVLADLNERLGSELHAAPLWLRASAVARDRDEAADLGRRASVAYLRGGDVDGARRVIEGMQAWAASPELARLKVDVERHGQSPLELAEALEELSRTVSDAHERAALLCEAARAALAAHDDAGALARATRASRAEPTSAQAQLLSRWLEYLSRRGPGTAEQARASAAELRSIAEPLTPAQQELHSFLLAEALDVAVGIGAGMRELTRSHAEIGPLPLIALGTAERLSTGGEPARALGLFDAALAGDLQRMRTHAAVALSAARSAQAAGELERALSYLELAAQDEARRAEALVLQAEIREQLKPVTDAASFGGDVPRPDPDVANEAGDSDALNAARRYSSRPPPSIETLEAAAGPKVRASRRPEASPPQEAERPANLAFPPADRAEEALLQALAKGSIEAGKELIARLENRAGRAHDWVVVCRRVAALLPGDLWTLDKLHDAAFADRNPEYGRAIEHVIAVFRGRGSEVPAPPLEEQAEQPDWVRAMLFRDAVQIANEALGLVWEGAEHVFRRDHGLYGVTGLERVAYGGQNAIAGMYSSAAFALGLARTPLFQRRSAGSITVSIALLSPPALILSGDVQDDSPELCFHLGSMLGATLSPYLLLFGSPENQVRAILKALRLAFGAAHEERGSLASVANLAEVLWESIPARSQRRLRELCSDPSALNYETALASAKTATRRAGLFVAGDLAVAVRETCADENIPAHLLAAPNGLSALCSSSPAVADLVRLATSPEYAETRWQVKASGRHSSNKWATIPGATRNR